MAAGLVRLVKTKIEAVKEFKKLKENYTEVEHKCHKAHDEFTRLIMLIDEAVPKAPDVRAASKLSRMRARLEICLHRLGQMQEAIKEKDCDRLMAINDALCSMRTLISTDAAELLKDYGPAFGVSAGTGE